MTTTPLRHQPEMQTNGSIGRNCAVFTAPLGGGLLSLSANAYRGEKPEALLGRLQYAAGSLGLAPVQGNVFGDPATGDSTARDYPVAFLARHDTPAGDLQSARILALPEGSFTRLKGKDGRAQGACWETPDARYLLAGALTPDNTDTDDAAQSMALWLQLKDLLAAQGFAITDVVRTWFFNRRILDWYDTFNRVRTAFFNDNAIFGALVPASTGVGASNSRATALSLDALAVCSRNTSGNPLRIEPVLSPLQCPANDYRSAFSRAVEIATQEGRQLLVSGTASIEPGGRTVHVGDLDAQIDLSLRVVAAILESRGMGWEDVARAVLYFPEIDWMPHFEARRAALGLPPLPAVFAHCDICRDDLLFEIELDAFKPVAV